FRCSEGGARVRPRLERGDGDGGRDRARAARAVREYRRLRAPGAAQAQAHRDRASRVGGGMRRLRAHPARAPVASGAVASSGSGARRGRKRPETAKGFIFVLLEDEAGMVNVIVRPDVYERYRTAVRSEPLLWVRGKLAKDDGTVNVLAEEAQGLKVGTRNAERGTNSESDSSAFPLPHSVFAFLKSMRRVAPESKDWG